MAQQQLQEESNRRARSHDAELSEKEADDILAKDPKDFQANRVKARACLDRLEEKRTFEFARKGIPIGENGVPLVARKRNGEVDVDFAHILSMMHISEGRFDEGIKCMEQYAEHFPVEKTPEQKSFLLDLEDLKSVKRSAEKNAEDLMKTEQHDKDKIEKKKEKNRKKKEKKKKKKNKIETSSNEAKKEKESVESKPKNESEGKRKHTDEDEGDEDDGENISVLYQIHREKKNDIFVGSMGSRDDDVETNSFIPATREQLNNYAELQNLGSSHAGILYIQRRICRDDMTVDLLAERVDPIDSIFEKKMNSVQNLDKRKWWILIENLFKRIFSEVVEALRFLYSKNKVCGSLLFGLYVTKDERAKLLPSMDRRGTRVNDFRQLVEKMKGIIGMPFDTVDVVDDPEFDLPYSLRTFLGCYNYARPKVIPWVLKSPYFWTVKEELKFLDGMSELVGRMKGLRGRLKLFLDQYPDYRDISWSYILDGRYKALWKKGDPQNEDTGTVPEGFFRVTPYKISCDIYRYLCASKKHINEAEYQTLDSEGYYNEKRKANDIKFYFPRLYTDSHRIIFEILCVIPSWLDRFMDIV